MSNQNNDRNNKNVSENIKDTAGAVFHSVHKGLEATENAAMDAVDATTKAINDMTNNDRKKTRR